MISISQMKTILILKSRLVELKTERELIASSLSEVDNEMRIIITMLKSVREGKDNGSDIDSHP